MTNTEEQGSDFLQVDFKNRNLKGLDPDQAGLGILKRIDECIQLLHDTTLLVRLVADESRALEDCDEEGRIGLHAEHCAAFKNVAYYALEAANEKLNIAGDDARDYFSAVGMKLRLSKGE